MYSNAAILRAIGESYFELENNSRPSKAIPKIIANLGQATKVDRIYIFKNHLNDLGEPCMTYTYEWCAPGVTPQLDFDYLQELPWSLFSDIETDLRTNRVINALVKDTKNGEFYEAMVAQGILSYLFIPIFSGSYFWGYIGFDNCSKEELFTNDQVSSLHALAATLGVKILNDLQHRKLLRSRKSFYDLINNMNDVVFRLDLEGTIKYLNPVWEKLSGYTVEESVGKQTFDFYESEYWVEIQQRLDNLINGITLEDMLELKLIHKNGQRIWVKVYAKLLKKENGKIQGITGTVFNIHQQKEMMLELQESQRSQQRLNELLQAVNEAHLSFFVENDFQSPLEVFLDQILQITGSKFGFIGEVFFDAGQPYLVTHTLTNIAWDEDSKEFFKKNYRGGIEFRNLDTLFGYTLRTGEVVLANDVATDPRASGMLPKGHPPLKRFLGIPVKKAGKFIGMMGFANKETDYTEEDVSFLQPLISGYANLISAIRINRARKKAEELQRISDEKYKLVSENTGDIIALHDLQMRFVYVSPSIKKVLGASPDDIIGKKPSEVFGVKENQPELSMQTEKFVVPHFHLLTGEEIYLEILMSPLMNESGEVYSYLATSRDVTQREKMLIELKETLAREQELNQMKTRFISMTSHEFRTPLATVQSSVEIMEMFLENEEISNKVKDKFSLHFSRISLQVERLSKVIADLLLIGKSSQNKIIVSKQPIAIQSFLGNLVDNYPVPPERTLKINKMQQEIELTTDPIWLSHIVSNLIDNAFKYSKGPKDPQVILSNDEKHVFLTIKDFGIGIPKSEQKYIFDSFFRAKNVSTIKGTGLGLNIVKDFADRIGIDIQFKSKENEGSAFTLLIPYE
ncbi:sensor histidine kinase [Mongoliitalea daihaiensis]|uniref:sensor histidine kinase n=1 Tax=Mongoliitalea daihaiensis TaxID=2782006 RepID=UPI001F311964|nr:PAS domain S-box protein [Mongoliitalea daihaiensis]UJP65214.1 PAS domain S-box protein [Mongoliitalea daihaiensis]